MVAATGDERWTIAEMTTMRGNARGRKEEVQSTRRTTRTGETTQKSISSRERV
jgi:hypothetical protein